MTAPKKRSRAKYATIEERNAAIGAASRARIAKNGHPRGMLGKKQNPEVLRRARVAAKVSLEALPEAARIALTDRQLATKRERYGAYVKRTDKAHSRALSGCREDLGGVFFRSRWEANYARYLNVLKDRGLIRSWGFETTTFWFEAIRRGVRSYKPDFEIIDASGAVYFVEVKGWMDPKSKTKLARMAKYYPAVDLRVVDVHAYREIANKLGAAIPLWERDAKGRA